jgi:hypothetical protein
MATDYRTTMEWSNTMTPDAAKLAAADIRKDWKDKSHTSRDGTYVHAPTDVLLIAVESALGPLLERIQVLEKERKELLKFVKTYTGWNGDGPLSREEYYCEFCGAHSENDIKIPHDVNCRRVLLLAAIEKSGSL